MERGNPKKEEQGLKKSKDKERKTRQPKSKFILAVPKSEILTNIQRKIPTGKPGPFKALSKTPSTQAPISVVTSSISRDMTGYVGIWETQILGRLSKVRDRPHEENARKQSSKRRYSRKMRFMGLAHNSYMNSQILSLLPSKVTK